MAAPIDSPLGSLLDAEREAVDTFARYLFDQDLIHIAGEKFDAIPLRASEHVASDYASEWRDLMNRYHDPDTREGSLDKHLHFPETQALYRAMESSPDWSAYLKQSQSQSQQSQISQLSQGGASQVAPASNQQQQKQKQQQKQQQQQLLLPTYKPAQPTPNSRSMLQIPQRFTFTSPDASRQRSPSPRRSERTITTPSRLNNFVMEKDDATASTTASRGSKRKADRTTSSDSEKDLDLPDVSKRAKVTGAKPTLSNGPSPAPPAAAKSTISRRAPAKRANPVPGPKAAASSEEAAQIAAAAQDPESEMSDEEPVAQPQKQQERLPLAPSFAPSQSRSSTTQTMFKSGTGHANAIPHQSPLLTSKASKRATKWTTYPPPSTSERAAKGTRRTDRSLLEKSKGVPQQKTSEALYENNLKLSQPAVDSLFGVPLSKGYDGFEFFSTFLDQDNSKKEWWVCLKCGAHKTASRPGSSSNLVHHGNSCKGSIDLARTGSSADAEDAAVDAEPVVVGGTHGRITSSSSDATGYSGLDVLSWLNGSHSVNLHLTRRRAVLLVIRNALAFRLLSTQAFKDFVQSMDVRMTLALKSHQTVRRDIAKIYKLMRRDIRTDLHSMYTLVSIQHDAWTNKGFQHSFVVVLASWVDRNWKYQEKLLSFDVVEDRHTGATFSGHLVRTLRRYNLDRKWFGPVISDSAGTNHRMLDLLEAEVRKAGFQQRRSVLEAESGLSPGNQEEAVAPSKSKKKDIPSISAFPDASQRHSGRWTAQENKILCMNHHINLAVRAGFATFGVTVRTKTQGKVLHIRPAIVVEGEDGIRDQVLEAEEIEEDEEEMITFDEEEEDEDEEEEYEDDEEEGSEEEEEEGTGAAAALGPEQQELNEDDGGGPGAEDTGKKTASCKHSLQTAIGRLEGFVTAVTRSDLRKKDFRRAIQREYLHDPDPQRSQTPIPPKPNKTRWNSHFAMLKGALKVKEAIDQHCRAKIGSKDDVFGKFLLSDQHWTQLRVLKPLLELAQDVTKELEAAEGTLCLVLDHHATLRDEIDSLREDLSGLDLDAPMLEQLEAFLDAIDGKLAYYRKLALGNRLTVVAAVLHPMFRLKLFEQAYPGHEVQAETHLRNLVKEVCIGESPSGGAFEVEVEAATKSLTAADTRASRVMKARQKREQKAAAKAAGNSSSPRTEKEQDEITQYLNPNKAAWRDSDTPYTWWRDNEQEFPVLAKLARILLGIPGSSSSSERVFSQAALYSTNRRARLTSGAIGQLVSVNNWITHGADPLIGLSTEARQTAATIARIVNPKVKL